MNKVENNSGIIHACYTEATRAGEHFIEDPGVSCIISGSMTAFDGTVAHTFLPGDVVLYRKNILARFSKQPANGKPFESVAVLLDQSLLLELSKDFGEKTTLRTEKSFNIYHSNELLINYFDSLRLLSQTKNLTPELLQLKKKEAVLLLLQQDPSAAQLLFDFSIPGKIDLEAFMNQHYKFNVSLPQLAYLTGRSLASFKRDFEKIFSLSPNRWIQRRRLQEAYYLINDKKRKPKDVFLEVGFETLSHFSYAFKKQFGLNPSAIGI